MHTRTYTQVLAIPDDISIGIFRVLSAILWIGNLEFQDSESEACQLTREDEKIISKIGYLLGISLSQIRKVCTIRQITVKGTTTDIALRLHEVSMWPACHGTHYFRAIDNIFNLGMLIPS